MSAMAVVWIPSLLRGMTGGLAQIEIEAATVRELIDQLEARHPGIKDRLVSEERLRPNIALVINGVNSKQGLRQPIDAASEVHFVPAMSGGSVGIRGDLSPGNDH
jgi:sulfur-carrier protein